MPLKASGWERLGSMELSQQFFSEKRGILCLGLPLEHRQGKALLALLMSHLSNSHQLTADNTPVCRTKDTPLRTGNLLGSQLYHPASAGL